MVGFLRQVVELMKKDELVGGLIWFILGISLCIGSIKLKLMVRHSTGPGLMPFLSGASMGVTGLILMLSSIFKTSGEEAELSGDKIWMKENLKSVFLPSVAILGYLIVFEFLGFVVTNFLFLIFLFKLREPKKWLLPLILTICTVSLSYLIFSVWLQCQFPTGIFRLCEVMLRWMYLQIFH